MACLRRRPEEPSGHRCGRQMDAARHEFSRMTRGVITATKLRTSLPDVVRRVWRGERITVLCRTRPAFQIVPLESIRASDTPLETDPLFRAAAVGRSRKGPSAAEHDALLYRP